MRFKARVAAHGGHITVLIEAESEALARAWLRQVYGDSDVSFINNSSTCQEEPADPASDSDNQNNS